MEAIVKHWVSGKAKSWAAKKAKLLENSFNKVTLEYYYIYPKVNANVVFFQVEHLNFWVFFQYKNLAANNILPISHHTIYLWVMELYFKKIKSIFSSYYKHFFINLCYFWLMIHSKSLFWRNWSNQKLIKYHSWYRYYHSLTSWTG